MRKNIWAYFGLVSGVIVLGFNGGCTKQSALSPLSNSNSTYTPLASNSTIYTPQEACNQFSSSLYNLYQGQTGNIFFSPFSIITAMAMAQEGAVGNTQVQMQNALDLNPNTTTPAPGFPTAHQPDQQPQQTLHPFDRRQPVGSAKFSRPFIL